MHLMKATNSIQHPAFFHPNPPMTGTWGETYPRVRRPQPRVPVRFALDTDELASTKQEIACGGILALCLCYTFAHFVTQLAF